MEKEQANKGLLLNQTRLANEVSNYNLTGLWLLEGYSERFQTTEDGVSVL